MEVARAFERFRLLEAIEEASVFDTPLTVTRALLTALERFPVWLEIVPISELESEIRKMGLEDKPDTKVVFEANPLRNALFVKILRSKVPAGPCNDNKKVGLLVKVETNVLTKAVLEASELRNEVFTSKLEATIEFSPF